MKRLLLYIVLVMCLIGIGTVAAQPTPLDVVATTSLIADVARNVGGDRVNVTALIPGGTDVHAFEPTPQDVLAVSQADVLLVNGAGLEAFLGRLVENAGNVEPVVVSNGVPMLPFGDHDHVEHDEHETLGLLGEAGVCEDEHHDEHEAEEAHEHANCDPHVWTDPHNVQVWAANIAAAFAVADPANADAYHANADAYIAQLDALDAEIREILSTIPHEGRILVTNHEFFGYFAHAYDFEVVGVVIPGGTTLNDPDPQALARLIRLVAEEGVPAIFAEVSAVPVLAETVAQEASITVVADIYSDSLSDPDGPAATYLDYMRHNAQTIATALAG
jgi:zinc/manganese transport system substrate-binding protein